METSDNAPSFIAHAILEKEDICLKWQQEKGFHGEAKLVHIARNLVEQGAKVDKIPGGKFI